MSLTPGSHVGPYEVIAPLGQGAMGVVFRARDTRLHRDVALKLLPDHFANEPDRLSRFQKEAQVLASLNHTNIAQIYGLEHVNGATCIVMELVEGETLEDRLKQGPLSYEETLDIARQLSEALATAHERGIVHRDLKPANIKLTPQGTVKVLDFGLAKALGPKASDTHASVMPTMASGSIVGTIVGTPGYMSPEQARGKEVDARSDIWAYGCIVYEMLTGRPAFSGETVTDIVAKIVTSTPDLNLLPGDTPRSMRLLLSAALNKSAVQRLQHIGDSRLFLDGSLSPDNATPQAVSMTSRSRGAKILVAALVALLAIVTVPAALYFRGAPPQPEMDFEISFPGNTGQQVISPDGKSFVYTAPSSDSKPVLWLRPINSTTARQLNGTDNVTGMMWSPDSQKLLFLADGKIKKLTLASSSTQVLGQIGAVRGADWNRAGVILMARISDNVIVRIPENGGDVTPVTKLDETRGEILHALPAFLPDGKHFLYLIAAAKPEDTGVFLASIDSSVPIKRVLAVQPNRFNTMVYVSPGYLVIQNNGVVTAQSISEDGTLRGEPVTIAEDVQGSVTVSQTGILTYRKTAPVTDEQLTWFDRQGKQIAEVGSPANFGNIDLSPKGDRVLFDMTVNNNSDIWVMDLARAIPQRISFDAAREWTAAWSPDGTRVVYASGRGAGTQIYEKSSTGSGAETLLSPNEPNAIPVHWTPDGKSIVFSRPATNSQNNRIYDTWLMPVEGEHKATPYLETGFDKFHARISPDGRWIAYSTNESGIYQIVVQTFPNASGGKWQISADGGVEPKWRHDSRELYYLGFDGKLMAVSISGPDFVAGRPQMLFQTTLTTNRNQPTRDRRYDVSPDGRFLLEVPAASTVPPPITVIVNWTAKLER